jgi:hypothetical protein
LNEKKYPFLDLRIVFEELGEHDKKDFFCVANHYTRLSGSHISQARRGRHIV